MVLGGMTRWYSTVWHWCGVALAWCGVVWWCGLVMVMVMVWRGTVMGLANGHGAKCQVPHRDQASHPANLPACLCPISACCCTYACLILIHMQHSMASLDFSKREKEEAKLVTLHPDGVDELVLSPLKCSQVPPKSRVPMSMVSSQCFDSSTLISR
jgi:hypothetical protein